MVKKAGYIWMSVIVDKKVKIVLSVRIYYKENYPKPNSDSGMLQTLVRKKHICLDCAITAKVRLSFLSCLRKYDKYM